MELVNAPNGFAACFPNGEPVITSVGFGNLSSTHCAFNSSMLAFQKQVYACLAGLMDQAGLTPSLQFGEFCWWHFTNYPTKPDGGMAYYDADTAAAAQAALGRPLHVFRSPDEDPPPTPRTPCSSATASATTSPPSAPTSPASTPAPALKCSSPTTSTTRPRPESIT